MWGISFLILFAVFLVLAWRTSAKRGLATVVLLSLIFPTWMVMGYQNSISLTEAIGEKVDLRIAISFVCLTLVFFIRPKQLLPFKFHWIDGLMIALVGLHVISDSIHDGFSLLLIGRVYAEWCMPYLVGRIAFSNIEDVKNVLFVGAAVCCVLGGLAAIECTTGHNLSELAFGERPEDGASRAMKRWGYKRSFGPNMHPIYCGTLQLLLLPWAIFAASWAFDRGKHMWYLLTPLVGVIGVVSTLSRGPIFAVGIVAYLFTWIAKPKWTSAMVAIGLCVGVLVAIQGDRLFRQFQEVSGELDPRKTSDLVVNGEQVKKTSSGSRLLIFRIYYPALKRAGLVGYGTARVTGFPVRVPTGPQDVQTLEEVRAIDNIYLLLGLRFGYAAPILFAGIGLLATWSFIRMSLDDKKGRVFYAAMAASLFATMLVLLTVWMPHDFGFVIIMYAGIAAGVSSRHANLKSSSKSSNRQSS